MTTQNASVAPPTTMAVRRYSEQVHALVHVQTREYLIGLALLAAEEGGYTRPREGEQVRQLLDEAIAKRYKANPDAYELAVRRGRAELAQRAARSNESAEAQDPATA